MTHIWSYSCLLFPLLTWSFPYNQDTSVQGFHDAQQLMWHMPEEYKQLAQLAIQQRQAMSRTVLTDQDGNPLVG